MRYVVARDDAGAIAILYALTLLVLIGFAALVLDFGALRADRRAAQTTADFASTAGASELRAETDGSPRQACETGLRYFVQNTPLVSIASLEASMGATIEDICDEDTGDQGFPDTDAGCYVGDPDPPPVRVTVDAYEVTLRWPVDLDDQDDGYDPEIDGHRCERFSVQVNRTRGFLLTVPWGLTEGFTGAPAVARATVGEEFEDVAALVVLDPHSCRTLRTGGQSTGGILVWEGLKDEPGIIQVDSDADGGTCQPTSHPVIRISGGNQQVKAGVFDVVNGQAGVDDGMIMSYALREFPDIDKNRVFQTDKVATVDAFHNQLAGGWPDPREPVAGKRFTREPVEHRYDCRSDYEFGPAHSPPHVEIADCTPEDEKGPHVSELRSEVENFAPAHVHTGNDCRFDDDFDFTGPAWDGDHHFDCTLDVRQGATVEFQDANIVVEDGIDLRGRLEVNASTTSGDNWIVVQSGDLLKRSSGSMVMGSGSYVGDEWVGTGGVFVLLEDGTVNTAGAAAEAFTWIAPADGGFKNLALWSESQANHDIGGNVQEFEVAGIFYMPNAEFVFGGSGSMAQDAAQFIAYRVRLDGGGFLTMTPDRDLHLPHTTSGVLLIR